MVSGRYFDPERATDSTAIILNEAAVSALGLQDPIGKRLTTVGEDNPPFTVIGVVNNFHIQSLHEAIRPAAIASLNSRPGGYFSVRIRPGAQQETLAQLEELWSRFVPAQPIDFGFFDESISGEYSREAQASKVVTSFSVLAIIIACLGLFGLASFTAGRRSKEIGIRKVLGASEPEIVFLLAKEFIRWVLVANVFAWPIAYYMMNRWLEGFAYRTSLGISTFVIAGFTALAIAILTVSYQAVKAARANPVDSIQYE
jgi:putative ABC transport system permease protein